MTAATLIVAAIFWWQANDRFLEHGKYDDRRLRSAWAWALVGGGIGSFFGLAGMGEAINAAPVGALIGYLAVSNLFRAQPTPTQVPSAPEPAVSPPARPVAPPKSAPLNKYLARLRRHLGLAGDTIFSLHKSALFNPVNAGLLVGLAQAHEAYPGNHGVQWWNFIEPACDSVEAVVYLIEIEGGTRRWSTEGLQAEYEAARKVGSDFFQMMTSEAT